MTLAALALTSAGTPLVADGSARLEGLLLGPDGRPAANHAIHLIDDRGHAVGRAPAGGDGAYAFRDLQAGEYSLGVESPNGTLAPVDAPPVRLAQSELARRDVKLLESGPSAGQQAASGNFAVGMWWAGLSPAAKAWTIIGTVVIVGITVAAITDDEEKGASPF